MVRGELGRDAVFIITGKSRVCLCHGEGGQRTGGANHRRGGVAGGRGGGVGSTGCGAELGGGGDSALARRPVRCETGGRQGRGWQRRGSRSKREVTQRGGEARHGETFK